jgi:hypothetical protein
VNLRNDCWYPVGAASSRMSGPDLGVARFSVVCVLHGVGDCASKLQVHMHASDRN